MVSFVYLPLSLALTVALRGDPAGADGLNDDICTLCARTGYRLVRVNASCGLLTIQSPFFGQGNYSNNSNCSLVLQSGPQRLVLSFLFSHFDVEKSRLCEHDSLCLNGRRLCGCLTPDQLFKYTLPARSSFTISFRSNNILTSSGFKIIVTTKLARNRARNDSDSDESRRKKPKRPGLVGGCGCGKNSTTGTSSSSSRSAEYSSEDNSEGGRSNSDSRDD